MLRGSGKDGSGSRWKAWDRDCRPEEADEGRPRRAFARPSHADSAKADSLGSFQGERRPKNTNKRARDEFIKVGLFSPFKIGNMEKLVLKPP